MSLFIGMTYDAKDEYLAMGFSELAAAEFDREETIALIETTLQNLGHKVERIGHIKSLVKALAAGKKWDLVFNIAEGVKGIAREAQVPALLDAYNIPYTFSDPAVLALTLDKSLAKRVVRADGLNTADFAVISNAADAENLDMGFPLFVKPLAEGTSKGVTAASCVKDKQTLINMCASVIHQFDQPALVESYLPGREFTVGLLGEGQNAEIIGVLEIIQEDGAEPWYSYDNVINDNERLVLAKDDPQAKAAGELALACWKALGGRDAGRIDTRVDANGKPAFIECNPLAGISTKAELTVLSRQAGLSYDMLIGNIIASAAKRIPAPQKRTATGR